MTDPHLAELIGRHLDGALDDAGLRELSALLAADPEARRTFARAVAHDTVLPRVAPRRRAPRVLWPVLAAAAVLLVAIGAWVALGAPSPAAGPTAAGAATVLRAGRELAPAEAGVLRSGDAVRAGTGGATLAWTEGTRAELDAGSTLAVAEPGPRKALVLEAGGLLVEAAPQGAGSGLGVRAGRLEVAVVGTRFRVASRDGAATVAVERGSVAVAVGRERRTLAAGEAALAASQGGLLPLPAGGIRLDGAAWDAGHGAGWQGRRVGDGIAGEVEATAERVANAESVDGHSRIAPGLTVSADVTLARPATLAVFLVCRRPDGSDWLGNYTAKAELPAGRSRRSWTLAELGVEKGAPLAAAAGGRIVRVAVCAWPQPAGLIVHQAVVGLSGR